MTLFEWDGRKYIELSNGKFIVEYWGLVGFISWIEDKIKSK
jgi:hypothetical protein